tara:strand:+ start:770 stop:1012 length:243 start_codon:yes stop_codon:yes gene_type:complete
MKKFFNLLISHIQFSLLLCSAFNLFVVMLAISIGQGEALANSIRGWNGAEVGAVMFGLPLVWGIINAVLDTGINKLNARV